VRPRCVRRVRRIGRRYRCGCLPAANRSSVSPAQRRFRVDVRYPNGHAGSGLFAWVFGGGVVPSESSENIRISIRLFAVVAVVAAVVRGLRLDQPRKGRSIFAAVAVCASTLDLLAATASIDVNDLTVRAATET